ncbi:MAG: response regulator, partial [Polyangiales bacterium]
MPGFHVLVIESTQALGSLVARLIELADGTATVLTSDEDALGKLSVEPYDAVCFAASLRGKKGHGAIEFARRVRVRHPTLPLLMLTSSTDDTLQRDAHAAGVTQVFLRGDISGLAKYLELVAQRLREQRLEGRVLLVEDSRTIARYVSTLLEEAGLEVEVRGSAREALQAFASQKFDVVVTDIVLPGAASGVVMVRELRSEHGAAGARVPVLVITSLDDSSRRLELIRSGVSDWMLKPVLAEELIARVGNLLRNKRLLERVEAQQAELRSLALTDQLTKLHNRHFLLEAAALALSDARRHGHPLSMLVVDVDRFKVINDTHGHQVGDVVLSEVAALLKRESRGEDIV